MRVYQKNVGWLILMIGFICSSFIVSINIKEYSSRLQQDYDVLFENSNGEDINLSNLKGKVVVINYWAKWCMPCLAEMPGLNQLYLDMRENRNIIFMAVDMDGNAVKGEHFMKKRSIVFQCIVLKQSYRWICKRNLYQQQLFWIEKGYW
ncbi:TlpA family protein disulfide reductase [Sphingobacterium sp. IITKGP-BTPF85]|uniref:TlpA family protein disulfide reductase n=1 Tax=Sphingobacterium sp. IITKGP-BTPF85 TaxID=1338009 RepID=UPI00040E7DEA|nr:TlpA disulfide reductase family protein [Sphingobacterium sp. IITKGP-BTPF85]KKX50585.1 hypothetical protein L950_0209705 [Sphingobacterium sp. IITKGP-BTPF85]